jgi:hypothetical protein
MVLEALTSIEQARHLEAIDRLRRQLFCRHSPAECFIVPSSEHLIAPYAERRWNAACGNYRAVHWGGLSYSVDCADPAGHSKFAVSHDESDRFTFWLSAAKGHTINAMVVRFGALDEIPFSYVSSYRRANVKPIHVGQRRRRISLERESSADGPHESTWPTTP